MPALTISDLPPELLYTILSHAVADMLFEYLFVGALVLPVTSSRSLLEPKAAVEDSPGLEEISSLGQVSVAWRITLQRILGAVLNPHHYYRGPNQAGVQSPKQQHLHRAQHLNHLTARHLASSAPATSTHHSILGSPNTLTPFINPDDDCSDVATRRTTCSPNLVQHHRSTLHGMQSALRNLLQHSIDTYRGEQDALATSQAQAGMTTPPLVPSTPPLAPHSIPPLHGAPQAILLPPAAIPISNVPGTSNGLLFGTTTTLSLDAAASRAVREYATVPIFQAALAYSQAAIFTCQSSRSVSWCAHPPSPQTSHIFQRRGGGYSPAGVGPHLPRVQRPDLSTLSLNSARLGAAREWTNTPEAARICPREVREVVDCGMEEVRERIDEAVQVCGWNDLLEGVFLRGERSEEVLESLDRCFDELEGNAGTIQMQHLSRTNLFKTVQTIARLGPISLVGYTPSHATASGEVWHSRAGALAFKWTGRVIEWTGL